MRVVVGAPARVRGRVVAEGGSAPLQEMRVVFSTPWYRASMQGDAKDSFAVGVDGVFSAALLIGERIVEVRGLPPRWHVKEVRRTTGILPEARLALASRQLIDDLEIVISLRN